MSLEDTFAKLRALNEAVPRPTQLPTRKQVDEAEHSLGVRFHPDFAAYLLQASDVEVGVHEPVTITRPESQTDLLRVCARAWEGYGVPRMLLPICESNGDFYCMDESGRVVF